MPIIHVRINLYVKSVCSKVLTNKKDIWEVIHDGSVNKVILVGNLGSDTQLSERWQGLQLGLATSENWKDKNTGERRDKTEWHQVAIFSEPSCVTEQYFVKDQIYIEGQLET